MFYNQASFLRLTKANAASTINTAPVMMAIDPNPFAPSFKTLDGASRTAPPAAM